MKKKRYLYFDKITGQVMGIVSDKVKRNNNFIECDNEDVVDYIIGKKSLNDVIVAYNRNDKKYKLLKRDNVIKLRYYGDKKFKIPNRKLVDYDLRLISYPDNILEVTINPERMSSLYATNFKNDVVFERGTEIRIYVMDKEGREIFKTIVIDAQKLLDNFQMFFNISVDRKNMSFYTQRVFDKYCWYTGKTKFISPFKDKVKFEVQKADTSRKRDDYEYHLIVKPEDKKLKIKNNIVDPELLKIDSKVTFYIVDKNNLELLHDKFYIFHDDLKQKEIEINLKNSFDNMSILYNQKYISVLIEG
jgi:hypothetical protein